MSYPDDYTVPLRPSFAKAMHFLAFSCILLNLLLSPWAFGSWEMWWFWPMTALLFAACFFSSAGTLIASTFSSSSRDEPQPEHFKINSRILSAALSLLPFLAYALIRARFPSAPDRPLVAMAAERSILMFTTPVLLATALFLSATRRRLRVLFIALFANAIVLALYAIISQTLTFGSDKPDYVLWVQTPWNYGDRAKGSFFCPNYLSAYLNLIICFCVAILFTPGTRWIVRRGLLVALLPLLAGNFMTASRGGLSSLALGLLIGIPMLAMRGYSLKTRIIAPVAVIIGAAAILLAVTQTDNLFISRVRKHPLYQSFVTNKDSPEKWTNLHNTFWYQFDRGTYIQSALRAWRSNPVWGIGPGQHSNRWPEFAATDVDRDGNPVSRPIGGDLSTMRKPRLTNADYHLYEVHSDWTQFLEEYGIIGLVLFLIPAVTVLVTASQAQTEAIEQGVTNAEQRMSQKNAVNEEKERSRRRSNRRRHRKHANSLSNEDPSQLELALPLATLLACLVMAIHSLGDFSFQIPAITWLFGSLLIGGLLATSHTHRN